MEGASTAGMVQFFKAVADNPFTRRVLKGLLARCVKDGKPRLEIALELYVGVRGKACHRCRLAEKLVKPVVEAGANAFGATKEQIKERFRDPYWRRGLVNVIAGISLFGVRRPYVPGAPFQVVWNVTRVCNLKCKHCYENAGVKDRVELGTREAIKAIDTLADAGVVILAFSGGEPTLRPDITVLIKHAADRGMYVAMATNATTLSPERVKELKEAGLGFVQISLDGVNPETHDRFRGVPGSFAKAVEGIKNCVTQGIFVEVAATVTRYNLKEVPSMIEFIEKLGANWFMAYNFIPTGRGLNIVEADLTPEEREWLLKELWGRMKEGGIEVLSTAPQYARVAQQVEAEGYIIPTHFYNPKLVGDLKRLSEFIGGCGAGRFYLALEPNGDLYPCVFFPHDEKTRLGNILKDDFEKIWRESKLLWALRDKDQLKGNCGFCEFRYVCGGCRARAYGYFADPLAPDPGCIRNKDVFERLIRSLRPFSRNSTVTRFPSEAQVKLNV